MITFEELTNIVGQVRCEPYKLVVSCIQCDEEVNDTDCWYPNHIWYMQATLARIDTDTDEFGIGKGRKMMLWPYMSVEDIVKTCLRACMDYAEHEVRESFRYQGKMVFDPHMKLEDLSSLCR